MVIKNIQKALLISSFFIGINAFSSSQALDLNSFKNQPTYTATQITACSIGIFLACEFMLFSYNKISEYIENKIVNAIADSIILAVTPPSHLSTRLTEVDYAKALQKKARLIVLRNKVLKDLVIALKDTHNFSVDHKNALQGQLRAAITFFSSIDRIRQQNPYEKEYSLSFLDRYIANQIVSSCILLAKPDAECTSKELQEKKSKVTRRNKVIEELKLRACEHIFFSTINMIDLFIAPL